MASNTENLGLLKKNPSTDGADTFNIQTMLNDNWDKLDANAGTVAQTLANILKPTTPPLIGLPTTTTPDGMFQALGNAGELHVWRKTVVTAEEIPAGYKLETVSDLVIATRATNYAYGRINLSASTAISVDDNGGISLTSPTSVSNIDIKKTSSATTLNDNCRGKFCLFTSNETYPVDTIAEGVYYIPSTATFTVGVSGSNNVVTVDTAQKVVSWAKTPAGTTTTYPVSTNPNAYQEGDDAKSAGYVVGDVVTGNFLTGGSTSAQKVYWNCSSEVQVLDDGTLTLVSPTTYQIHADNKSATNVLPGKFAVVTNGESYISGSPFAQKQIVYIPSDTVVNVIAMTIDRYQPVTGYAAIPAGTTIEYLGKLGDKARVQVVSYVGTGVSGVSNKNSLTFDFAPKLIIVLSAYNNGNYASIIIPDIKSGVSLSAAPSGQSGTGYAIISEITDKTVSWYSTSYVDAQMNTSGYKYMAIAIG